jgi:conjugal transfer pilus assembly protein TraV
MPLRQASQVMRIWVAPWVDSNDNLNWATYVYTEVTPKRWSFGEQEVRHQGMPAAFIPR